MFGYGRQSMAWLQMPNKLFCPYLEQRARWITHADSDCHRRRRRDGNFGTGENCDFGPSSAANQPADRCEHRGFGPAGDRGHELLALARPERKRAELERLEGSHCSVAVLY